MQSEFFTRNNRRFCRYRRWPQLGGADFSDKFFDSGVLGLVN